MTKLRISDDLELPLDAVTQKLAWLGRTGSGKSYGATKLAELILTAGAQVLALDPVGIWYGLRLGHGFDIPVFGGLHGDMPLEPTAGAIVADAVIDHELSAVLDVSGMLSSEQARFAGDFATRFFERKKRLPSAVHLFVEECQEFVPQNAQPGEQRMLHAFERLIKLGRNFGIGVSLISQRPQEVNKKALNQTECLFAFQMTGPQERKAIEGWVSDKGLDADIGALLPKLAVGQPHVWSPQWLKISKTIRIAKKQSLDASSTPKVGEARASRDVKLGPIDLARLRNDMAATIEKAKAEDPKVLRARIVELERALKAKAPSAPAAKIQRVEVPCIPEKQLTKLGQLLDKATKERDQLEAVLQLAKVITADINTTTMRRLAPSRPALPPAKTQVLGNQHEPRVMGRVAPERQGKSGAQLNGSADASVGNSGLRRMLIALAQRPQGLTNKQLGVRAGVSSRSGTFSTYLSKARSNGWVDGSGALRITPEGLTALGMYDPLPTGTDLLDHWTRELGGGASRMLQVLAETYPTELTNEQLGEKAGISHRSGTFSTYLSRLRTLELVEGRGALRASKEFFE